MVRLVPADQIGKILYHIKSAALDVRESEEWDAGHIPGAKHVARGFLESRVEGAIGADRSQRVVIYCASGTRSALAAHTLEELVEWHVQALDPTLAPGRTEAMEGLLADSVAQPRFAMLLIAAFVVLVFATRAKVEWSSGAALTCTNGMVDRYACQNVDLLSFLARKLGTAAAEKIITSGRIYTAAELHELGVVDVLAEVDQLRPELDQLVLQQGQSLLDGGAPRLGLSGISSSGSGSTVLSTCISRRPMSFSRHA